MSRSCHRATFSTPGLRVAAQHAGEAGDALGGDRVALVRHRARPLLARAERLLDLAHLRALQVADLGGEALEAGAGERDRLQQLGVAVARDDLGGDGLARAGRARSSTLRLVGRRVGRVGADRAADRADRGLREGALEPVGVAVRLEGVAGQLEAERRRLGVDAVGAADADGVGELARPLGRAPSPARARPPGSARPRACDLQRRARCRARRRTSGRSGSSARPRPADALSTSTNAATSWSVIASRSLTASTVKVAARIASQLGVRRLVQRLRRGDLDVAPGGHRASSVQTAPSSGRV